MRFWGNKRVIVGVVLVLLTMCICAAVVNAWSYHMLNTTCFEPAGVAGETCLNVYGTEIAQ